MRIVFLLHGPFNKVKARLTGIGEPPIDLALISPVDGWRQTASILQCQDPFAVDYCLPELSPDPESEAGKAILEARQKMAQKPNAALRDYMRMPGAEHLRQYGASLATLIQRLIRQSTGRVLVVGEGILLQAIGLAITGNRVFQTLWLGEAEGFEIDLDTKTITLLKG